VATPIKSPSARPLRVTALGTAASIPWCCIVPAALAAAAAASSLAGRWLGAAMPVFLAVSVALFVRAHYVLWVKRHGTHAARMATVFFTIVAIVLWAVRLSPEVVAFVLG
jgi:hypothetical protein